MPPPNPEPSGNRFPLANVPPSTGRLSRGVRLPSRHEAIERDLRYLDEREIRQGRDHQEHEEQGRRRDETEPDAPGDERKNDSDGDRRYVHDSEKPAWLAAKEKSPRPDAKDH